MYDKKQLKYASLDYACKFANRLTKETAHDQVLHIGGHSVDSLAEALEADGWTKGSLETNGWEWDYWLPFEKNGVYIQLSGSGYYGVGVVVGVDSDRYMEEENDN